MSTLETIRSAAPHHAGSLEVHLLGTVDYSAFLGLQEYLTYEISGRNDTSGVLLLCEHAPVITIGREGSHADLLENQERIDLLGIETHWVSRSGGAYVHAPGQLAAYLMLPLDRLGIGLSAYREMLESALSETCRSLKIPAKRSDVPGLWGRGGQIAHFGTSVRSWVTNHGMFLNISISPDFYNLTIPNRVNVPASSIQNQRLQPLPMSQVRETVIRKIAESFGYQLTDISTGHPLLRRQHQKVVTHV